MRVIIPNVKVIRNIENNEISVGIIRILAAVTPGYRLLNMNLINVVVNANKKLFNKLDQTRGECVRIENLDVEEDTLQPTATRYTQRNHSSLNN